MKKTILMALTVAVAMVACKKDDNTTSNPSVIVGGQVTLKVPFSSNDTFTYFRFSDSSVVSKSDSATSKWDIAIRKTTILVNSVSSGPGNAGVIVQTYTYPLALPAVDYLDTVKTAPSNGYQYDTTSSQRAIKEGSWYDYNNVSHAFTPDFHKVFVFRTADGGHYAKMAILAVDYGPFTGTTPTTLLYKLHFAYQANGTTTF